MQGELKKLNRFNIVMGVLHFVQAILVLLISDPNKGKMPITINYLSYNSELLRLVSETKQLFTVNLSWFIIAFFLLSSLAHFFIATLYKDKYESDLKIGINKIRWFEYALSASMMMIAISLLSGIFDFSTLFMIFILDALMNLLGYVMEKENQGRKIVSWTAYVLGCIAGIVPWIVFAIYVYGTGRYGAGNIPDFVYWIYVSIFIFFNSFAINMILQYKKTGPWENYLFGEKIYLVLSLVAKSLLAWQVFAGTLRP